MRSDSGDSTLIEYNDFIGVDNRADSLCDNDYRCVKVFFYRRTKPCVRPKIKSGKAVVKNIDIRLSDKCSCNRKTLLLTAGKIGTALTDAAVKSVGKLIDKFTALRNVKSESEPFFACILVAVKQIFSYGSAEKRCFLGNEADKRMKLLL